MSSIFQDILGRTDGLDRPAFHGDRAFTHGAFLDHVARFVGAFERAAITPGDRVALCVDQGADYAAALVALRRVGAVAVLMAPDWTDAEKDRVADVAEVRFAVADMPLLGTRAVASAENVSGDATLLAFDVVPTEPSGPDDAVLIFTSGTTGAPKGVILTESCISANVRAVSRYLSLGPADGSPVFTPPCYAYSLSLNLTHLWSGAAMLPVPAGLMFPIEILQGIAQHRLTGVSATPTAFRLLAQVDPDAPVDLTSVRYVMTGGQFLDLRLVRTLGELFPKADVVNMYGCSENSPRISYLVVDGQHGLDDAGYYAVGRAVDGTRIEILDGEGRPVAPGTTGEVVISGTSLMRGYWRDPESTAERLVDGRFHTRDLGYLDAEGLLHLTGRATSIINIGNEKVSPEEVEKVLAGVEGVREAAVYGAPDPMLGESVHALVVLEPGARVQVTDLQRHCRRVVSGYKVPRRIDIVATLPRTLYGKIDRTRLTEMARENATIG